MEGKATPYALLGLLTLCSKGASGYDLRQLAENSIGHFWSESYGQIYPVLKQLTKKGHVVARRDSGSGKRERILYSITPSGSKELKGWLDMRDKAQAPRNETLLKLFFGPEAPAGAQVRRVRELRDQHRGLLERYEAVEKEISEKYQAHPGLPYWLMTLDYGRRHSRMATEWCDATLKKLESMPPRSGRRQSS